MMNSGLRQTGFSLLELLVAFVIMAFSLGMLYQASGGTVRHLGCLLYTSPSPRDRQKSRMPSSA